MRALFSLLRYTALLPVLVLVAGALALFVYGSIASVHTVVEIFEEGHFDAAGARALSVEMIEMIDLILLGTVLFITAIGLYQLFIDPDADVPRWMSVHSLEELKFNLLAVVVVMLSILFLGGVASVGAGGTHGEGHIVVDDGIDFLGVGLAIAAVLAAIGAVVWLFARAHAEAAAQTPADDNATSPTAH